MQRTAKPQYTLYLIVNVRTQTVPFLGRTSCNGQNMSLENTQITELSGIDRIILFRRNDEMRNFVAW